MPQKLRSYTPQTLDAARILGNQIALARRERRWTAAELGERVGVTARTVTNIEQGSPAVAIGIVFEAATLLGLPLFGVEADERSALVRRGRDTLALLPRRVYATRKAVYDDF